MDQALKDATQQGDINALYNSIKANPNILKAIDEISFIDTPLHIAAMEGHVHFALEMMRLMPSFARKLNQDGFSPVHLALQKDNNTQMVSRLVHVDPDLVRVKGREGLTPLHYVAAKDDLLDVLAEFLIVCPGSIQDLTIRAETALHIALKKNMLGAFEVLLGWLQRGSFYNQVSVLKNNALNWKDDEGNTLLHIATFNNQPKVVRSLIKNKVDVNATNLEGLTALDILRLERPLDAGEVNDMLLDARGKRASCLPKVTSIADYLRSKMKLYEIFLVSLLSNGVSFTSRENRSAILVVAVLIATATFQAGINPPGGFQQVQTNMTYSGHGSYTNTNKTLIDIKPLMWDPYYSIFQMTNSTAFCASMGLIILLFPITFVVLLLEYSFIVCYIFSVTYISPPDFVFIIYPLFLIPAFSLSNLMFKNPARQRRYCNQVILPNFTEQLNHQSCLHDNKIYFLVLLSLTSYMIPLFLWLFN